MKQFFLVLIVISGVLATAFAQTEPQRVAGLESRVSTLEQNLRNAGDRDEDSAGRKKRFDLQEFREQ